MKKRLTKSLRKSIFCLKPPIIKSKGKITSQILLTFPSLFLFHSPTKKCGIQENLEKAHDYMTLKIGVLRQSGGRA